MAGPTPYCIPTTEIIAPLLRHRLKVNHVILPEYTLIHGLVLLMIQKQWHRLINNKN